MNTPQEYKPETGTCLSCLLNRANTKAQLPNPKHKPPILIGLIGKKGSGKNLAADGLREFEEVAFADPLREVVNEVFGATFEEMSDRTLEEQKLDRFPFESPRHLLQQIGTNLFRQDWPEVWVEHMRRRLTPLTGDMVITDVRFNNEAILVKELGGFLIRIVCPAVEESLVAKDLHPSETAMESIVVHKTIQNDGSEALLHARMNLAILELTEGRSEGEELAPGEAWK